MSLFHAFPGEKMYGKTAATGRHAFVIQSDLLRWTETDIGTTGISKAE